ncbi:selenocysteine-specific translation elongation factor [Bacillus sp. AFS015802]|uniref:selenocysteine-specific translation elongation factor n=1 Tax=Bacillus sp. AFS015802 TaxID=2033486 RepID=UPI000BF75EAC|nr:selenocysteine-specific translation elongation factor [Bacillus sp. AFS015802]PFA67928.1 selenocysteine-specific translation elongation factor [Bacillus sp. AFS015802]
MRKRYYTIGMAGHIDHGKTTLTKALTSVDTDRLKEEKERRISIEPGFASLYQDEGMEISVVDVPGHERFIRQMIAGVAGIDLVILVVAADEGVMPQTKEHLDILSLLGIRQGIVVLTKTAKVEEDLREMAREEVIEELKDTVFEGSPILLADSVTGEGVVELKEAIISSLKKMPSRDTSGDFRLPIDQVFTIKGQGAVVRGTIYEGSLETGQELSVLPQGIHTRAKQIQVHHHKAEKGYAGQRAAVNLSGVDYKELKRGNVLVSSTHFFITNTIDVSLKVLNASQYDIRQRMTVMVHSGTSEVMGKLVFFDRNKVHADTDTILCQIRLDEHIVVKRGDRFIVRRPSPVETIGGGWIIKPNGGKYPFGEETIAFLQSEMDGTPGERVLKVLDRHKSVRRDFLMKEVSLQEERLDESLQEKDWIHLSDSTITHRKIVKECQNMLDQILTKFHDDFPLLKGVNRGELKQHLSEYPGALVDYALEQGRYGQENGVVHLDGFFPRLPPEWEKRCSQLLVSLERDGTQVRDMEEYFKQVGIPEKWHSDFYHFFVQEKKIVPLDERISYSIKVYNDALFRLKQHTDETFHVGEAKEVLGLSRKYMIPFLEKLDKEGLTVRIDEKRKWIGFMDKGLKRKFEI